MALYDPSLPYGDETSKLDYQRLSVGNGYIRFAVADPAIPPQGTVVLAQGRREFIEKKYIEAGRDLLARGYRIIHFDWRGQGLSSRFFTDARRQRDHLPSPHIYMEDMQAIYEQVVQKHRIGPLFILAHSMGALNVTHWLSQNLERQKLDVQGFIMTAPAYHIHAPGLAIYIMQAATRLGFGESYALGQHDYNEFDRKFYGNLLTHDHKRYEVMERYFAANPDLLCGGITWDWGRYVYQLGHQLHEPGFMERIRIPTLALMPGADIVVSTSKAIPLIQRMPNAEAIVIRGAYHELMNEADKYRDPAWQHIDRFFGNVNRSLVSDPNRARQAQASRGPQPGRS